MLSLLPAGRAAAASSLFREAQPGRTLEFPRDHGVHPDFKQEWWYYSGHLQSPGGGLLGYQVTFFRQALESPHPLNSPAASAQNIFAAHLALTIPATGAFISRQKIVPEILGLAGASPLRLQVNVGDWRLETRGAAHLLHLHSPDLSLDLTLTPSKPLALHGQGGYVSKDAKIGSSYHYSITRLATTGEVAYGGRSFKVTGTSWFDREFCTTLLGPRQPGWDWFALQLTDGRDVMLYLPRDPHGRPSPHAYGAIVEPDGRVHRLACGDFRLTPTGAWKSPRTGATYPAGWRLIIPGHYPSLTIVPTVVDQEVSLSGLAALTYWEGQVTVTGPHGPQPVSGRGYAELTGYARPVPRSFDAPGKWAPKTPP